MENIINILCATDKKFIPYCGIMLTSVFENNKTQNVNAYILVDESVEEKDKAALETLAKKYNQRTELIYVDSIRFDKYPTNTNWSKAMYYRLLVEELLPDYIDKIIYFDCDIIVTCSLWEMWNTDIENYAVGAVMDVYSKSLYEHLGLSNEKEYFNSGSMLINLKYWRKHQLGTQCMQYMSTHKEELWCPDQDVLNYVLQQHKLMLPVKYNFQIQFLKHELFGNFNEELKQYIKNTPPIVIHYAFLVKPWMMVCHRGIPYYHEWCRYKRISLWKRTKKVWPKTKRLNWFIKRYVLWPFGIMYDNEFMQP